MAIRLRPEAEADVISARTWYQGQRPGLGDEFLDELDRFTARIQESPKLYAVVLEDVRRGKLRRFPYVVYYRALQDEIEVVAVLHGSRDPALWQERL